MRTLEVFSYHIQLETPFTSASGTVSEKETFLFRLAGAREKSVEWLELPLSPSMGWTSEELRGAARHEKLVTHPLITNLATWFDCDPNAFKVTGHQTEPVSFLTIGIGDEIPASFRGLIKLKGSPRNLEALINFSKMLSSNGLTWAVDFNASLSVEQYERWEAAADFSRCRWTEQPLAPGLRSNLEKKRSPVFYDEEMAFINPNPALLEELSGFVLKPWRHSLGCYLAWHNWANKNQKPYVVGSMLQSAVADSQCDWLNQFAPVRYATSPNSEQLADVIAKAQRLGRILIN